MSDVRIERCRDMDAAGWLDLRKALWPETPREVHRAEIRAQVDDPERYVAFVAYATSGAAVWPGG